MNGTDTGWDDLRWLGIQDSDQGKGLFSDSDDSDSSTTNKNENCLKPAKLLQNKKPTRRRTKQPFRSKKSSKQDTSKENKNTESKVEISSKPLDKNNLKTTTKHQNHNNQQSLSCKEDAHVADAVDKLPETFLGFSPIFCRSDLQVRNPLTDCNANLESFSKKSDLSSSDMFKSFPFLRSREQSASSTPASNNDVDRCTFASSELCSSLQSLSNGNQFSDIIKPCFVRLSRDVLSSNLSLSKMKAGSELDIAAANISCGSLFFTRKRTALRKGRQSRNKLRRSLSFSHASNNPDSNFTTDSKMNYSNSNFSSKCQSSIVALHSSKKSCITNNRRRRRCDFKIADGFSTYSFIEHTREAQESMYIFQHSVVTGHSDSHAAPHGCSLHSFDHHQNISIAKKPLVQSTPYIKSNKVPFPLEITPFDPTKVCFNVSSKNPLSSTPSLDSMSCLSNKTSNFSLFQKQQKSKHIDNSFEELTGTARQKTGDLSVQVNKVLFECNQVTPHLFENLCYDENCCEKLGEGVFGEVYKCTSDNQTSIAVKIVPVNGTEKVNNERQKTFSEILPEIVNSNELSTLSEGSNCNRTDAFIHLFGVHCVTGKYPDFFLQAWDDYRDRRGTENDRPDFFPPTQHYVVFEFTNGGVDLEHFNFRNAAQALSVLKQTIAGLAVAEELYHFEHRDLHWGNILVESSRGKKVTEFTLRGITKEIKCLELTARIIDFTFSRMSKGEVSLYHDLSGDDDIFTGDASVDYQFEIYRMMREETNNDWSQYRPKTNVFWVHYLLHKFLNTVNYRLKASKLHANAMKTLSSFYETVLNYSSCTEIALESSLFFT